MDTVLKSCISSVTYLVAGTPTSKNNMESVDSMVRGKVYSRPHAPASLNRSKGAVPNCPPTSSSYAIPCNFPSTPLPCSGGGLKVDEIVSMTSPVLAYQGLPDIFPVDRIPQGSCSSFLKSWLSASGTEGRGDWVRPLGYAERFMTLAGQWGNMSTVYALSLESRGPISIEHIKYTAHLMFRRMPHLRLRIGTRARDHWWRQMASERVDVEEIESDDDVIDIFESLLKRRYNTAEGPLWFVRFVTSLNRNDLVRDANFNVKHKYVCIFGFHHNFSDGTTNMNFCNIFISLLNKVLNNEEIHIQEEGRFAHPIHDDLANQATSFSFLLQLFGVRIYKGLIAYCEYVKNFLQHYPMPNDTDGCTMVLQNEFDELTTERLLKRCKMEGVTLNTAFTAAANIGLFRMILQRDSSVEQTRFDSQQAVNMRRYWPKEKQKDAYGCHISMVDIQIPTSKNDIVNFWEYARKVHRIICFELNVEKRTLKMQPLSEKLWLAIFVNSWMSKLRLPSANDSHYCITNMGDVTSTFTECDEVNVKKILRSVSCHFMQALCQHTLQTFRGRFYYSLDYYPQKMAVGTARAYASSLMDTLRQSIHLPN